MTDQHSLAAPVLFTLREAAQPARALALGAGLHAVVGDERSGKTQLLRTISAEAGAANLHRTGAAGVWMDLNLPQQSQASGEQLWAQWAPHWPRWDASLAADLAAATGLDEHLHKAVYMLSTGSRRKVAIIALLASGATITCLDQPYAGLDRPSIQVLREFLSDAAQHRSRAWVVADFEADQALPWQQVIDAQTWRRLR